jgi:hypothetical protein
MVRAKKGISERAVERLEQKGYLKTVRAEMKAEAMKCLSKGRGWGDNPQDEENKQARSYVLEFSGSMV